MSGLMAGGHRPVRTARGAVAIAPFGSSVTPEDQAARAKRAPRSAIMVTAAFG